MGNGSPGHMTGVNRTVILHHYGLMLRPNSLLMQTVELLPKGSKMRHNVTSKGLSSKVPTSIAPSSWN